MGGTSDSTELLKERPLQTSGSLSSNTNRTSYEEGKQTPWKRDQDQRWRRKGLHPRSLPSIRAPFSPPRPFPRDTRCGGASPSTQRLRGRFTSSNVFLPLRPEPRRTPAAREGSAAGRLPGVGAASRRPSARPSPSGALTEVPGPLLLGEDPGGIGGVEGGGVGVGMLLAEEFAEGALHRLVLFHAAAGHAGAGEGPSLGRPALPGTEPCTVSLRHSTRPCPAPSFRPARGATGAAGAAARLEMRATWTGKRLRL